MRVRPINGREQGLGQSRPEILPVLLLYLPGLKSWFKRDVYAGSQRCTVQLSDQSVKIMTVPEPHTYTFDAVAGEPSSQEQIFQSACIEL